MKVRKNNRGFTLVELLVSTAILGIIAVAASAFMVTGTRLYSSLNYAVRLEYEAQLAMAQLQEYTIDCTQGIAWDVTTDATGTTKTLYIANGDGDISTADEVVHAFVYNNDEQTISYKRTATGAGFPENLTFPVDALMAEHVTAMDVDLNMGDKEVVLAGNQADIMLEMARGNKTYSATQVLALRNQPVQAKTWLALWNTIK
jgi:prepilin-type N-terminal cleavage/methylation domain-containing protein